MVVKNIESILATICRIDRGTLIFVQIDFIYNTNLDVGEALVALLAVQEAASRSLKKIIIDGDSK